MADNSLERRNTVVRKGKGKQPDAEKDANPGNDGLLDDIPGGDGESLGALEQHVQDRDRSWETDSMLADMLDGLADSQDSDSPDFCTPEEVGYYRRQLIEVGPEELYRQTIDCGNITAKKLLTAFGARPPAFLENHPAGDDAYRSLLLLAMTRELAKRPKLLRWNTIDDAVHLLRTCKNIMVITGAGISTSLGIPDFRSAETGLYSKLHNLGLEDPQEVFSIALFKEDPSVFFSIASDILVKTETFSPTHGFIAMLEKKGKLLVNYSQNIDNLEAKAGISPEKLMQCHGSFATATCIACGHQVPGETIYPDIKASRIPYCPKCTTAKRSALKGKSKRELKKVKLKRTGSDNKKAARRSTLDGSYNNDSGSSSSEDAFAAPIRRSGGILKPDITFFGEALPPTFHNRLEQHDQFAVDLLLVIGTSLKVAPVSEVPPFLPRAVPQIVISRTPVNHHTFDIELLGDCDAVVAELARRCGWDLRHDMIPADQHVSVETAPGYRSRHVFTAFSPSVAAALDAERVAAAAAAAAGAGRNGPAGEKESDRRALGAVSGNREASVGYGGEANAAYASGSGAVTTTRSGRRSGRGSPK